MPPAPLVDLASIDDSQVLLDLEQIRQVNPQRFEMEQLTAIISIDETEKVIIGFKDVSPDEFWVRGHMPGYPLLPGVLMCEAAAQLASCYCVWTHLIKEGFVGFGGMEDVRFRGQVRPGDRLLLIGKATRLHRRQTIFDVQGFVDGNMVFHGRVIGVNLTQNESSN